MDNGHGGLSRNLNELVPCQEAKPEKAAENLWLSGCLLPIWYKLLHLRNWQEQRSLQRDWQ